jgi:hypothetical protein
MWRSIRSTTFGCDRMKASICMRRLTRKGRCPAAMSTHLQRLFVEEDGINLGEARCHRQMRLHVVVISVKHNFPERRQELVCIVQASLND